MPTTRDFKSLGRVAKDAQAVIPGSERVKGTAYRNVEFSNFQQTFGKSFNNKPTSENVNQQLNNLSAFTDLSDTQGVIGWKDDVTYNVPALVLATDGKLYQALRDNLDNVDPVDDDPESPQFWQEIKSPVALELDLSSQEPGDEGAEQVGTSNRNVSPVGRTLQKSLDENGEALYNMRDMNLVAVLNQTVDSGTTFPSNRRNFNIASVTVIPNDKQLFGKDVIGYVELTFTNPIPTDNVVMLTIRPENWVFRSGSRLIYHATSNAYADLTATSIKIGSLSLLQYNNLIPPWGFDDPAARRKWAVGLFIYTLDP